MYKYDYLIVGAGLFGSVFAFEATKRGKTCLVLDKRDHIAGNIYTKKVEDIMVHQYGAHIFHTADKEIWEYMNQFSEFNHYRNSPIAIYGDELYNLPFNMNTFHQMWGVKTPEQAKEKLREQRESVAVENPKNLEEQALSLVGRDVYEKLIQGYTQKQWGKQCTELPAFIIKRLPLRFTYDNNYFNDRYQGIPTEGYTKIVEKMLEGSKVILGIDYKEFHKQNPNIAKKIIYTGMIDEYYEYEFGELAYRSLQFEEKVLDMENFQGNAVINYTEESIPYTRSIEHKHFAFGNQKKTVVTYEYPKTWKLGDEPYYPINDDTNMELYQKYKEKAKKENHIIFGGRLGAYQYYDMDKVIAQALSLCKQEL